MRFKTNIIATMAKRELAKDFGINLSGISILFSIYFATSQMLDRTKDTIVLEEAAKISIIVLIASSTGSLYKNAVKNREDKHFRLHLLGTLVTNAMIAGSLYFTKSLLPPQSELEETNKTIFSTPYFMNIVANYAGDGAATIVNKHFDIRSFRKKAMLFTCSTLPVVICNSLFAWKFGKDPSTAIAEVLAIAAFNATVHMISYLLDDQPEEEKPLFANNELTL